MTSNALRRRTAFTLIELVLVLVIMTIIASLALNTVESNVDQTRFESTQQVIQNVDDSILSDRLDANGTKSRVGFFVDVGGLPRPVEEVDPVDGRSILTLRELWQRPIGLPFSRTLASFKLRAADDLAIGNTDTNSDGNKNDYDNDPVFADPEVVLGTGWRGPYLRLPVGADSLQDSWGHKLVSYPDSVDDLEFDHLRWEDRDGDDLDDPVNLVVQGVLGVRSLGRSDTLGGASYEIDTPATTNHVALRDAHLRGQVNGSVIVSVNVTDTPLSEPADSSQMEAVEDRVFVQLFYPDENTGLIRIERAEVAFSRFDDNGTPDNSDDDTLVFAFKFEDTRPESFGPVEFPVGVRPVRGYFDVDDNGTWDQDVDIESAVESLSINANMNRAPELILN